MVCQGTGFWGDEPTGGENVDEYDERNGEHKIDALHEASILEAT